MSRESKDQYFMRIARAAATQSTCDRASVGTVLVIDRQIISTGYNGAPWGFSHCDDVGHDMVDNHCVRTVHSEVNAITQAAKRGVATKGATCYCTLCPCLACVKILFSAGIRSIVYEDRCESTSDKDVSRILNFVKHGLNIKVA